MTTIPKLDDGFARHSHSAISSKSSPRQAAANTGHMPGQDRHDIENADAKPLGRAGMKWFVGQVFETPEQTADPRLNLVARTDLAGLPPATIINAQIDPLRSEGETYAEALSSAGVPVTQKTYPAVTHEFFGMGAVVDEARDAVDLAAGELRKAFGTD